MVEETIQAGRTRTKRGLYNQLRQPTDSPAHESIIDQAGYEATPRQYSWTLAKGTGPARKYQDHLGLDLLDDSRRLHEATA